MFPNLTLHDWMGKASFFPWVNGALSSARPKISRRRKAKAFACQLISLSCTLSLGGVGGPQVGARKSHNEHTRVPKGSWIERTHNCNHRASSYSHGGWLLNGVNHNNNSNTHNEALQLACSSVCVLKRKRELLTLDQLLINGAWTQLPGRASD